MTNIFGYESSFRRFEKTKRTGLEQCPLHLSFFYLFLSFLYYFLSFFLILFSFYYFSQFGLSHTAIAHSPAKKWLRKRWKKIVEQISSCLLDVALPSHNCCFWFNRICQMFFFFIIHSKWCWGEIDVWSDCKIFETRKSFLTDVPLLFFLL